MVLHIGIVAILASLAAGPVTGVPPRGQDALPAPAGGADSLTEASRLFFNAEYDASAEMSLRLRADPANELATYEQRSSALHFQLKRELAASKTPRDRKRALRECARCASLVETIIADVARGRELAHARLRTAPADIDTLFFLGKLDLTYVWLHNDTLGQRTGWGEYREARRVLDEALEQRPDHIRARVARAFMYYVIDTRVPWAFRWVMGGGDRKGAVATLQQTVKMPAPPMVRAEAQFALWEMLTRDADIPGAVAVARDLAREFPENRDLQRFLSEHGT